MTHNQECIDVDECTTKKHNCTENMSKCINTEGSFECECSSGYEMKTIGQNKVCYDIDECATGKHNCGTNQKCKNLEKSYFSCECESGYQGLFL